MPGEEQAIQVQSANLWVIFWQDPKLRVCLGGFIALLNMKLSLFADHLGSASLNSSLVLSRANTCNKQLVLFLLDIDFSTGVYKSFQFFLNILLVQRQNVYLQEN